MSQETSPDAPGPGSDAGVGRIGPNAILRLIEALDDRYGRARTEEVFRSAGQHEYLDRPPDAMVDERAVTALYSQLPRQLGFAPAAEVSAQAGLRTGEYLLAHRIPAPAQRLMKLMPAALAARTLLAAVERHSWTFAGSGHFRREPVGREASRSGARVYWRLSIDDCPLCRGVSCTQPICAYYAATFERIFREVVTSNARVTETACHAAGASNCVFEVSW